MSKVICVRLPDESVWTKFITFVAEKYHKTKGVLGLEVCEALKFYLEVKAREKCTHTHSSNVHKPKSRTMKTLKHIAEQIMTEYENEIPQTEVERIITQVAGGDKRTLRKYTRLLVEHDVLKRDRPIAGTKPLKFIFKVNGYANRIR